MARPWQAIFALAYLPSAAACPSAEPADPDAEARTAALVLSFEHLASDDPVAIGEPYTTPYAQIVMLDELRYWVSNAFLERGGERYELTDAYHVVELSSDGARLDVEIEGVSPGEYDRLGFHVGLDPDANRDPDLAAGASSGSRHFGWSEDRGHTFFAAAGSFEVGDDGGALLVDLGTDDLYRRLEADLPSGLAMAAGERRVVPIRVDLGRLFAGVDLAKHPEIVGGPVDSVAGTLASNYGRMFDLVAGGQAIAMAASSPNLGGSDDSDVPSDDTPPVVGEMPVAVDALECGAIEDRPAEDERGCFTPFYLGEGDDPADAGLFTFITSNGGPVRAVAPGVVESIEYQEHSMITHSDLYRIRVRAHDDAVFAIEYRWIKDFPVREGDEIEAGEVIGGAGDYLSKDAGIAYVGVLRTQERLQRLCPADFATPEVLASFEEALAASNAAWPDHARDDLCAVPSLVCTGELCETPAEFEVAYGDVDAGRRIYASSCASCHGAEGEGDIGGPLCYGPGCACNDCTDHDTLASRITDDMPPEGYCDPECAADVASFIMTELTTE